MRTSQVHEVVTELDRSPDGPTYGVVAVGASAGGISALQELLSGLPAAFPLPILVVQHLSPNFPSKLPQVLGFRTGLRTRWAEDGLHLLPGTVHVCPPNRHLVVGRSGRLALSSGPKVNFCRPSVDVLFESVAAAFGPRAIGVVLSGMRLDGAQGIAAIGRHGGMTIAQDEATAEAFEMPAAAIDLGRADLVLAPLKAAVLLRTLAAMGHDPAASWASLG